MGLIDLITSKRESVFNSKHSCTMGTFSQKIILCEPNEIILPFTDYIAVTFDKMLITEKKNIFMIVLINYFFQSYIYFYSISKHNVVL